jgi:hypothetical protein
MQFKEISDLGLTAGLMTLGYQPIERRKEGRKVIFTFESNDEIETKCDDYFNNRLDVDAHTYYITVRGVKSSIYQMEETKE